MRSALAEGENRVTSLSLQTDLLREFSGWRLGLILKAT